MVVKLSTKQEASREVTAAAYCSFKLLPCLHRRQRKGEEDLEAVADMQVK